MRTESIYKEVTPPLT